MVNKKFQRIKWNLGELKTQFMRLYFSWLPMASRRIRFLRKHHIFAEIGENVFWQPRKYPLDGKMLRIHNNVAIAVDVQFILHDISWMVLERLPGMSGSIGLWDIKDAVRSMIMCSLALVRL